MKLLFNHNGKPDQRPYPFIMRVTFPSLKHGVSFMGNAYRSIDEWVAAVGKQLLAMGISDFQYLYPPKQKTTDPLQINFLFKTELDKLRFCSVVFKDKAGIFEYDILSQTASINQRRLRNLKSFTTAHDISHAIFAQPDGLGFKVATYRYHDFLAVATHFTNGTLDKGIQTDIPHNTPRLLTKS